MINELLKYKITLYDKKENRTIQVNDPEILIQLPDEGRFEFQNRVEERLQFLNKQVAPPMFYMKEHIL